MRAKVGIQYLSSSLLGVLGAIVNNSVWAWDWFRLRLRLNYAHLKIAHREKSVLECLRVSTNNHEDSGKIGLLDRGFLQCPPRAALSLMATTILP